MSFEPEHLNVYEKTKLTIAEQDILDDWYNKLGAKYRKVGHIIGSKKDD